MFVALAATSCKITDASATYQHPSTYINTATVADLDVSNERISFTFAPSNQVRRGGNQNVIKAAIREALRVNGGGDVLVDLEYITVSQAPLLSYMFGLSPIREVTVSGYPAKYKNFRSPGDNYILEMSKSPAQSSEAQPKPTAAGLGFGLKLK